MRRGLRLGCLLGCLWGGLSLAGALGCASPADMAKDELGSGPCAKQAARKCEKQLAGSDRAACLKRETYMCEQLEQNKE
jgi:hypothetical protein